MRAYIDHLLALLPFEPDVHQRLGGPRTTYVGHPLIERLADFRPALDEAQLREKTPPTVLILPGSRRAEIERLLDLFGDTAQQLTARVGEVDFVLPAVSHLKDAIEARVANWPCKVRVVLGEDEKLKAFRQARAALAASGTVSLELALAQVPMVIAYRVGKVEEWIVRALATAPSIVLPNLILGEKIIPEFVQEDASPSTLAKAVAQLIGDTPAREAQLAALARLDEVMQLPNGQTPSALAAQIILSHVK
jgi:lipid-A-disaccharide synthase